MALPEPKIIAFVCNWCTYAGADLAGVARIQYPPNVRLIRLMCSGRVHTGFILKAFEQGADGVLVSGCHPGDCHYRDGNLKCTRMVDETRELLALLGIEDRRLRLRWISASEGALFATEIDSFVAELKTIGPLASSPTIGDISAPTVEVQKAAGGKGNGDGDSQAPFTLSNEQLEQCLECSACVSACPVGAEREGFSPKQMLNMAMLQLNHELQQDPEIWSCLSCGRCVSRCPAGIDFPRFNREYRQQARISAQQSVRRPDQQSDQTGGNLPQESHQGVMQLITALHTRPLSQQRTGWTEGLAVKASGEFLYFVGCSPYFEVTHRYLELSALNPAHSVVRLLNRIGVEPVVSDRECCCGHDAYWSGEQRVFEKLARKNIATIRQTGATTVLFACPEGYNCFKDQYSLVDGPLPFEVVALTDFLADRLPEADLAWREAKPKVVTYQDPCRLGRFSGYYETPRDLIRQMPGTRLVEMERNRENAMCCGTSAWMSCGGCAKGIQTQRLAEAAQTGAELLITACPKCRIHLSCALRDLDFDLAIQDIFSFIDDHLTALPEPIRP